MDEKRERTQADKQSRNKSPTLTDPSRAISSPARTCDLRAAPDPAIQDPNKVATLTQLMCIDRLGAPAIYLRSEKRGKGWLKFLAGLARPRRYAVKQKLIVKASLIAVAIAMLSTGSAQAQNTAPFQIVETTIDDIHMAFRSGRLTARQLVQSYLDRINAYDKQGPTINSIITLNPDALAEADRLDAAFRTSGLVGPLHGITILVKDEIDTAGMPTTLGTIVFKDYRPPKDAFVIDKLRKAGAIILGKATLSEFAAGDTYGSIFGVTRNPYDPRADRRRLVRWLRCSTRGK